MVIITNTAKIVNKDIFLKSISPKYYANSIFIKCYEIFPYKFYLEFVACNNSKGKTCTKTKSSSDNNTLERAV